MTATQQLHKLKKGQMQKRRRQFLHSITLHANHGQSYISQVESSVYQGECGALQGQAREDPDRRWLQQSPPGVRILAQWSNVYRNLITPLKMTLMICA